MGIYVDPCMDGNEFRRARRGRFFVDKTGLLKITNRSIDTSSRCICVSRPRRFGKTTAADMLADVEKAFRYVLERDNAFVSGEVGLPYIIQTAENLDLNDTIARFITRTEHPSYYAFVLDGLTTLGEYWENNPRSHCHDMMGHIVEWFYNGIAGIQSQEPGFNRVVIRPYLPEGMHAFTCRYQSVRGEIFVKVREEAGWINLTVRVPDAVSCTVDAAGLQETGKKVVCL